MACGESRLDLAGRTILFSSVLDRWALAEALHKRGARVLVGDAAFALRLPVLFPGLNWFHPFAVSMLPALRRLPLSFLYPLGRRRQEPRPGLEGAFAGAEVLAGDFHFLRSRLPARLDGRWVIATGLDEADLALLAARGVSLVVELGPVVPACPASVVDGSGPGAARITAAPAGARRGLSANLAEALVVAPSGQNPSALGPEGMLAWCRRLGFHPTVYQPPHATRSCGIMPSGDIIPVQPR
jgi:hypothetical protein